MTRLFLRIFKQKSSASGEVGANQIWRKYLKVMVKSRRKVTKLKVKNESWWSSSKCFEISNLQYMYIAPSCAAPDTIREWIYRIAAVFFFLYSKTSSRLIKGWI